ncbi:MAG: DUF692 domain-containing protein [Oligoflexia bacterium]|nr:DUF692 domain-containing protein [Oligoflexia bacterium]
MLNKSNPLKEQKVRDQCIGLGLRRSHYDEILKNKPPVSHFEFISDNFLTFNSYDFSLLEKIRESYPLYAHGVALSIGSDDALNFEYLKKIKELYKRIEPLAISDHLCWSSIGGHYSHDLLPFPLSKKMKKHFVEKIQKAQEFLQTNLVLENISTYVRFNSDEIPEGDFVADVAKQSGCKILLDVNNVFVNSVNFQFSAEEYIDSIDANLVDQIHIAGAKKVDDFYIDDHGSAPNDDVIGLLRKALNKYKNVPIHFEWDTNIPSFDQMLKETKKICQQI